MPRIEEAPPKNARVVRLGRRRVVVARPNPKQYGHQADEILLALLYGRETGLPVVFLRPRHVPNPALFEVEAPGVRVLRSRRTRTLAKLAWTVEEQRERFRIWRFSARDQLRQTAIAEIARYGERHPEPTPETAERLRLATEAVKARRRAVMKPRAAARVAQRPYWRRRWIADPIETAVLPPAQRRALAAGEALGISFATKLVAVHARERGYKVGVEKQDKDEAREKGNVRDDSVRNARIENYFAAIDHLVELGYTVVRVGDPTMAPLERPGVVDLATSPLRTPELEVYCLWKSDFVLCGQSGPEAATYLLDTPLLLVNVTDPISGFPVRADGICLLKTVVERETGRALSPFELLDEDHLADLQDPVRFLYLENSPEQILEATQEMLALLAGDREQTPGQVRYRERVLEVAGSLKHRSYVRKWGSDEGVIGRGRIARSLVSEWAEPETAAPAETSVVASA